MTCYYRNIRPQLIELVNSYQAGVGVVFLDRSGRIRVLTIHSFR